MIEAGPYPNEEKRLKTLESLGLLDTPIDGRFEKITKMVCRILDVPIALFNLIDADRQFYKSAIGISATQAPKKAAFCTHAIHEDYMLLIPNTHKDERFHDNPFVTGEHLDIGFYAGCPIRAPNGMPIGTLCAIDKKPRDMSEEQLESLRDLADMIETEIKMIGLSNSQQTLIEELDEARRLAMIDPMTRLWNRSGVNALLEKEIQESIRSQTPITIVITDIDHFKKVNDTYGHPTGDAVITEVAKRLSIALRTEDVVGRIGGEEFLIILTNAKPENLEETVERIRQSICETPISHEGQDYPVTMSFGAVSAIPNQAGDTLRLIKHADDALYEAKKGGRNRVVIGDMNR